MLPLRTTLSFIFLYLIFKDLPFLHASSAGGGDQVQQAIQKCRDKLSEDPDFPQAQLLLGKLLESIPGSDLKEAAKLSWDAGSCFDRPLEDSKRAEAFYRAATIYKDLGEEEKAAAAYLLAIPLLQDQAWIEQVMHEATPLLLRQSGSLLEFGSPNHLSNLAMDLVKRFPQSLVTLQFHGAVARKTGYAEEAFQSYHAATLMASNNENSESIETFVQTHILAASAAREGGRTVARQMVYLNQAMEMVESKNNSDEAHNHLKAEILNTMGIAQKAGDNTKEAIRCFQAALEAKPGDGHALAQLASLHALPDSVQTLDADYVQGLFDGYAHRFEDELVNTLDYKGHEMVVFQLAAHWDVDSCPSSENKAEKRIIDLGCGTGLVGEFILTQLPHLAPSIIGIDLSERMVQLARSREYKGIKVYQKVEQNDAAAYLESTEKQSVDAIVAADVFIYIGELGPIFASGYQVLTANGVLVFSVELTRDKQEMFLLPSGRFGHSKEYVEAEARKAGFHIKLWKEGTLRKQRGKAVPGAVVVMQKDEV